MLLPKANPAKGLNGEKCAIARLKREGFEILRRNYRCHFGEVDIIARKKGEIYFVEVKARWSDSAGHPLEQVTWQKQQKIIRVAKFFLQKENAWECPVHLSVIGIDFSREPPEISFLPDAFEEG